MAQPNSYLYLSWKVLIYETEKETFNMQAVKRVDFAIDVWEWNKSKDSFCVGLCSCVYY
jgi:hypothetical protein